MATRYTHFNDLWLQDPKYVKWLLKDNECNRNARCKLCMCTIQLSNMGKRCLDVHSGRKKHMDKMKELRGTSATALAGWLSTSTPSVSSVPGTSASTTTSDPALTDQTTTNLQLSQPKSISEHTQLNLDTTKAEILWTLNLVTSHQSYNSTKYSSSLFSVMFPDSEIAKKMTCAPTKCSYLTVFGLAPYFENRLLTKLSTIPYYSVSFDESYNSVTKNEQMDFNIRFFDEEKKIVVNRYLGSEFLGHTTATDLLNHFKKATSMLDPNKITQISMDGPAVNMKFFKDYVEDRRVLDPDNTSPLEIGSCGLHVIHGAFKTAFENTGWKLASILRSLFYLFHGSPARMKDFMDITGSNLFPLQFCGTRWVEDSNVAKRAVICWDNVKKYIHRISSGPKNKIPKCNSYKVISDAVKDNFTPAKLHVFISISNLLKPFLMHFQTDKPMIPFLAQEISKIIKEIMDKFIKKHLLPDEMSMSSIMNIDINQSKNYIPIKNIVIGFSALTAMSEVDASIDEIIELKEQCLSCYKTLILKLLERSPLKFELARQLCCLNPHYMCTHPNSSLSKFEGILKAMISQKFLKPNECDLLVQQFKCLQREIKLVHKEEFLQYSIMSGERIDILFAKVIGGKSEYSKL